MTNSSKKYAQLSDLNDDCKLLILDDLDFVSLITMSEINDNIQVLAADVYRRKFAQLSIVYQRTSWGQDVFVGDCIEIYSFDWASRLIHNFGAFMQKFQIKLGDNEMHINDTLLELVHHNCKALKSLQLQGVHEDALNRIKTPFETVEDLELRISFTKPEKLTLGLNEMFPQMHSLSLDLSEMIDGSSVVHKFQNLKRLDLSYMNNENMMSNVYEFIELNPQIKSLTLYQGSARFLGFISEKMPELEHLKVQYGFDSLSPDESTISFRNVKRLGVGESRVLRNFDFQQLQHLEINSHSISYYDWSDFIQKHTSLTNLTVTGDEAHRTLLPTITGHVPNLIEASFIVPLEDSIEVLISFLQTSPKLERLDLTLRRRTMDKLIELENLVKQKWNLTETTSGCLIVRKA